MLRYLSGTVSTPPVNPLSEAHRQAKAYFGQPAGQARHPEIFIRKRCSYDLYAMDMTLNESSLTLRTMIVRGQDHNKWH